MKTKNENKWLRNSKKQSGFPILRTHDFSNLSITRRARAYLRIFAEKKDRGTGLLGTGQKVSGDWAGEVF